MSGHRLSLRLTKSLPENRVLFFTSAGGCSQAKAIFPHVVVLIENKTTTKRGKANHEDTKDTNEKVLR